MKLAIEIAKLRLSNSNSYTLACKLAQSQNNVADITLVSYISFKDSHVGKLVLEQGGLVLDKNNFVTLC